tara:strand:+ start:5564 stop:5788 length:225 start_codon:yes stop_codon:yes gene_type:complete
MKKPLMTLGCEEIIIPIDNLLFDIIEKLDNDYGNGDSFDVESFTIQSDEEAIAYSVGYIRALRRIIKNLSNVEV